MCGVDLEAPDGHRVVDADVPRGVDRQVSVDRDVADAALLLGEEHFLAPDWWEPIVGAQPRTKREIIASRRRWMLEPREP